MSLINLLYLLFIGCLIFSGCSSIEEPLTDPVRRRNQVSEYIDRRSDEFLFAPPSPKLQPSPSYSWEQPSPNSLPKITRDFFRCQGSEFNPMRTVTTASGPPQYLHDCGGMDRHSLPVRDGQEFIYPILIELLNAIQTKTGKRVIITSGHRCPTHNTYVDDSRDNSTSKHTIGAAVTFYVQGMEYKPSLVVQQLFNYYNEAAKYKDLPDYQLFKTDDSPKQPTKTPAWLNKEIVARIYESTEGRNCDNRHPYPYISLTVRYDSTLNKPVSYYWDKAHRSYMSW